MSHNIEMSDPSPLPMSPIQRVLSRLPFSPPENCGPTTSSPLPFQARKRARTAPLMSVQDMRRRLLVKQVQQKLSGTGIKITTIPPLIEKAASTSLPRLTELPVKTDIEEIDLVSDDSLTLEENNPENNRDPNTVDVQEEHNHDLKTVDMQEEEPIKTDDIKLKTSSKIKKVKPVAEVKWKRVKRLRRKVRLFYFHDDPSSKPEVSTVQASTNQQVPALITGCRPLLVVPGLEYGLGEGEGVLVDTEEEMREIKMANNEKYMVDSFVKDNGYLSEDEMAETPDVGGAGRAKKQRRRAGTIQARLKFDKLEDPDILGCFWRTGTRGGANPKVKKWQAIVFTTTPIPTSFTTPEPNDVTSPASVAEIQSVPVQSKKGSSGQDYNTKYSVKYLVKHLVQQEMRQDNDMELTSLASRLNKKGGDLFSSNPELLERYLYKYCNKFKYILSKC